MPAFTYHNVPNYGEPSEDPFEHHLNIGVNAWFEADARFKARRAFHQTPWVPLRVCCSACAHTDPVAEISSPCAS